MVELADLGNQALKSQITTVQYDPLTSFVLTYINWIILAISLFVIIYCASEYYKERAKKSGTD